MDEPEVLYALWYREVERSQVAWAGMIADGGLDVIVPDLDPAWNKNRRRILVDLLEENLIHLGHVDLLREGVDGRTATAGRRSETAIQRWRARTAPQRREGTDGAAPRLGGALMLVLHS